MNFSTNIRREKMSNIEYIMETVRSACSLAMAFKEKGCLKDARELLDCVAEIEDRILYLQQMKSINKEKGNQA